MDLEITDMKLDWYNKNWRFTNGVRWVRLSEIIRIGFWEQCLAKVPVDHRNDLEWEWPHKPFIPLWKSSTQRYAIMLPWWP